MKLMEMIFLTYFEYVCYLLCCIMSVILHLIAVFMVLCYCSMRIQQHKKNFKTIWTQKSHYVLYKMHKYFLCFASQFYISGSHYIKATNITKLVQMSFRSWFGYLIYICWLSSTSIILKRCLYSVPVNRNWSVLGEISSIKHCKALFTYYSQYHLHEQQKSFSFLFWSHFFPFSSDKSASKKLLLIFFHLHCSNK